MQLSTGAFRMGIVFFMEDAYSAAAKKLKVEIASLHSSLGLLKTVGAYAASSFRGGLGMLMGLGILLYPFLESIKAAQEFDMFEATYQTLLKSKEKGTEFVNFMRDFALITPFQTMDYVKGNMTMAQHGIPLEDMKEYTKLFSNMTAVTQKAGGTYYRLASVMGKIYGEGEIIRGTRMNQLGIYGFSLKHDSQKVLGWDAGKEYANPQGRRMTFTEAIKIMKYTEAAQTVNGKTLTEQIGATAWGKFTNLGEYMHKIMVGIGRALMGSYIPALDNLVAVLEVIYELVSSDFGKAMLVGISNLLINVSLATVAFTAFWGSVTLITFALSALRTIITGMSILFYGFRIAVAAANAAMIALNGGLTLVTAGTRAWAAAIGIVEALTFWEVALAVGVIVSLLILVGHHMKNAFGDNILEKIKTLTIAIGQVWSSADTDNMTFSITDKLNEKINSLGIRKGLETIVGIILNIKAFAVGMHEGFTRAMSIAFVVVDIISSLGYKTGLTLSSTFSVMKVVGTILGFLVGTVIGLIMMVIQVLYSVFSNIFDLSLLLVGKLQNFFGYFQWGDSNPQVETTPITSDTDTSKQSPATRYSSFSGQAENMKERVNILSPTINTSVHLDGDEISKKVTPRISDAEKEAQFRTGY